MPAEPTMLKEEGQPATPRRRTMPLWPDAGMALGLSRNGTYDAARRGEIAGVMRFGKKYVVAIEPFEKQLLGDGA